MTQSANPVPGGLSAPPFRPTHYPRHQSPLKTADEPWVEVLVSACHFGLPVFLSTLKSLCLHPERNSSLILRADPLSPKGIAQEDIPLGMDIVEEVRVRLMPRQPRRDGKMDQRCLFFRQEEDPSSGRKESGVVLYVPEATQGEQPYYYPPVRKLAYRWEAVEPDENLPEALADISSDEARSFEDAGKDQKKEAGLPAPSLSGTEEAPPIVGRISISYLPWPSQSALPLPSVTLPETPTVNAGSSGMPFLSARRTSVPRKRSPLAGPAVENSLNGNSSTVDGSGTTGSASTSDTASVQDGIATGAKSTAADVEFQSEKLQRTCLALLERLYKHGYGQMAGYRKRVNHDVIVSREPFQDLYLILKERHRHLDSRAPKPGSTKIEDVKRHVFKHLAGIAQMTRNKDHGLPDDPLLPTLFPHSATSLNSTDLSEWGEQDVAVAAFLMLLWRDMYPARSEKETEKDGEGVVGEEWDRWGRPIGGFVDLGCGNGLLVHILASEGYHGNGYELRKRRTWPLYPPSTQQRLIELPITFPDWFPGTMDEWDTGRWDGKEQCAIKEGCFIIGNHADEITPWIPLLSLIPSNPVPSLSLPCCAHTLDSTYNDQIFTPPPHSHLPATGLDDGLEQGNSRYKAYLMWLGYVGVKCGWEWEKEGMRVPSTRGWGIVARRRWTQNEQELRECREWALEQVEGVRTRGTFKVRVKEGKEH